jgi:hypothetical protein
LSQAVTGQAPQIHGYNLVRGLGLTIRLWVEREHELQLDTGHGEQLLPKAVGEDWILVTDNGAHDVVEFDNGVEEDLGHCRHRIRMPQWQKVSRLGKSVHHRKDDRLPLDLGQSFNEVDCNASPHRWGNNQGLHEARRVELFRFVALAHATFPDKVTHHGTGAEDVEVGT